MNAPRILVVEDEAIVALDIQRRLTSLGYQVVGVTGNSETAVTLAQAERPDLVLMDIRLQGAMDGITAAEQIRQRSHLPVVFLTAYSEDTTLDRAKHAEPFGYILKPFEDRELRTVIEMALYKHRAEEEIRRLNRLYAVLSEVNRAIVRVGSRAELLTTVCRIAVEHGRFKTAWIGWLDPATRTLRSVARCGDEHGHFSPLVISVAGKLEAPDPVSAVLRDGQTFVSNDLTKDDRMLAQRAAGAELGIWAMAAVPIRFHDTVRGILCVSAGEPEFFHPQEIRLLEEVALNISFALERLEREAQRRRVEEELRLSQAQLLANLENTPHVAVQWYDEAGRVLYWNPASEALYGWRSTEALGKTLDALIQTPEDAKEFLRILDGIRVTGQPFGPFEAPIRRRDGARGWVLATAFRMPMGEDRIGFVCMDVDITERRRAEAAARESESRLRAIIDQAPFGAHSYELEGGDRLVLTKANKTADRILGIDHTPLIGRAIEDAFPGLRGTTIPETYRHLASEGGGFETEQVVYEHGQIHGVFAIHAFQTGPQRMSVFFRDVTERAKAEAERDQLQAQLMQAQKMEAIGQLAGGVAHDFNNILAVILIHLGILQMDAKLAPEMRKALNEMEDAAKRAANLTRQLLLFSRRQVMHKEVLDLNWQLHNLLKMLRRLIGEQVSLELKGVANPIWVEADIAMLDQIVVNLAVNARDAMPKGGKISLDTQELNVEAERIPRDAEACAGRFACLTVTDTGCGMDAATLEHIFEPFFTTKEPGKGTGIGLATVYGAVKQHNGWVEVESAVGQGSAFRVFLPLAATGPVAALAKERGRYLSRGSETILLVEDEMNVRTMISLVLEDAGYRVLQAANGVEAQQVWLQSGGTVDLLLSDMVMPEGMTGLDLASCLRKEKPDLKVIIASGYSLEMAQQGLPTPEQQIGFLLKPFEASLLLKTVRERLDAK